MLDNVSINLKSLKGVLKMLLFTEKMTIRSWIAFTLGCLAFIGICGSLVFLCVCLGLSFIK